MHFTTIIEVLHILTILESRLLGVLHLINLLKTWGNGLTECSGTIIAHPYTNKSHHLFQLIFRNL